ncbi:MAG TPA: arginine deiminase family protein [Pyrinomonadaceae bacterium]|nr:arginine deiminase family protein [Pyrinomonadaceae bacterium]
MYSPATYGGAGWRLRESSHEEDIEGGAVWHSCGVRSEAGKLLEVLLTYPSPEMLPEGQPNEFLFLERPDIKKLQQQAETIAQFYQEQGVTVRWARPSPALLPNFLFQRDLFWMTPEGALLCRPASQQRAREARFTAAALAELGIPILATPRGRALFEGADALWLDHNTVLIGVGLRTNEAGAGFVSHVLRDLNVNSVTVRLPEGIQHLLGIVNFVDRKLAAVRRDKATNELLGILREAAVEVVFCEPVPDLVERLGMNFVTLASGRVVMPSGCPSVRDRLNDAGVITHELDISEYCKAAGGLGCLTGIIRRQELPEIVSHKEAQKHKDERRREYQNNGT